MSLTNEQAEAILPLAAVAATQVYRRVNDGLSWQDLQGQALLWASAHPRKVGEYLAHEDDKQGDKLLLTAMMNDLMRAAQRERAQRLGFRFSDIYWYSLEQIREDLLPCLWDRDAWSNPPQGERDEQRGATLPNERGGWMTLLADVADAYGRLSTTQKTDLLQHFGLGWTYLEMGRESKRTEDQVQYAVDKAVKAVHHKLGGQKPEACPSSCECKAGPLVAPRHSRNGQRLAELERGYEG